MKNNFVAKFMNRFNRSSIEQDNRQELLDKIELLEAEEVCDNIIQPSENMKEAQYRALNKLKDMGFEQLSAMVEDVLNKEKKEEKL